MRFRRFRRPSERTAAHAGLDALSDGDLLQRAQRDFDVLVTLDQAMAKQQNLTGTALGVVILRLRDQSSQRFDAIAKPRAQAIARIEIGQILLLEG